MKRTPSGIELGEAVAKGLMWCRIADPRGVGVRYSELPWACGPYKGGVIRPGAKYKPAGPRRQQHWR